MADLAGKPIRRAIGHAFAVHDQLLLGNQPPPHHLDNTSYEALRKVADRLGTSSVPQVAATLRILRQREEHQ